jgi:predicted CXXCH cytochrome family protein
MFKLHKIILSVFILLFIMRGYGECSSSWLKDLEAYHTSAHGNMSCLECHGDKDGVSPHPDPALVNRSSKDFSTPETCTGCHGDLDALVVDGIHGGKKVKDPAEIENCLKCHDPHTSVAKASREKGYDPGKPVSSQCGVCHEPQKKLPEKMEDGKCLACHVQSAGAEGASVKKTGDFCFHCHDTEGEAGKMFPSGKPFPRFDRRAYAGSPHANVNCLTCHSDSANFGHGNQKVGDCRTCHAPHDEKKLHDAHSSVSCAECHVRANGVAEGSGGAGTGPHTMKIANRDALCASCHVKGNTKGASSMVLPAKSVMCMPCHTATFSVGDTVTVVSLIAFALGMAAFILLLLDAKQDGETNAPGFINVLISRKIPVIFRTFVEDVLLQKRLLKSNPSRWVIHGLIFYPFVIRMTWGLTALLLSLILPGSPLTAVMLDKNHPVTALAFDLTGLSVVVGVILAVSLKIRKGKKDVPDLPHQDMAAVILLGLIIISGFIVEGMRIAMTSFPEGSYYAFAGWIIGFAFKPLNNINDYYGYVWYAHALVTGAFLAYLPFSRMLHILISPLVLMARAAADHET